MNHESRPGTQPAPTLALSCFVARNQTSPAAVTDAVLDGPKIESTEIPIRGTQPATSRYPLAVRSRLVETRTRCARNPACALKFPPLSRRADLQSGSRLRGTLAAPTPAPKKTRCAFALAGLPNSTRVAAIA